MAHTARPDGIGHREEHHGDSSLQGIGRWAQPSRSLGEAGSDKTRILSAQIFLVDMATKAEMDEVWNAWLGPNPDHWPQRACVGAALAYGCLVEIILLAAKR